jgi:hypothetical protein
VQVRDNKLITAALVDGAAVTWGAAGSEGPADARDDICTAGVGSAVGVGDGDTGTVASIADASTSMECPYWVLVISRLRDGIVDGDGALQEAP